MDVIADEIAYYKSNRKEFIEQYAGKHLVIKGKAVIGVYSSNSAALEDTMKQHQAGTFIIEHPVDLSVHSFAAKKKN